MVLDLWVALVGDLQPCYLCCNPYQPLRELTDHPSRTHSFSPGADGLNLAARKDDEIPGQRGVEDSLFQRGFQEKTSNI